MYSMPKNSQSGTEESPFLRRVGHQVKVADIHRVTNYIILCSGSFGSDEVRLTDFLRFRESVSLQNAA
jgi:hypothetical protein